MISLPPRPDSDISPVDRWHCNMLELVVMTSLCVHPLFFFSFSKHFYSTAWNGSVIQNIYDLTGNGIIYCSDINKYRYIITPPFSCNGVMKCMADYITVGHIFLSGSGH